MVEKALRQADGDLENHAPDASKFSERMDESVVRRIEDIGDDLLDRLPGASEGDPMIDDAGVDLAEDFGREFLVAATTGEDIGEIENAAAETAEKEGLALHEVELIALEDLTDFAVADDGDSN